MYVVTYISEKIADELVINLINFLDTNPNTERVFEEEKTDQVTPQKEENTISFPDEALVDLITDETWLTLDCIGKTLAP